MSKRIDLTNQRFGRLVVLKYYGNNAANSNAMWLCQCDCGNKTVVDGVRLRSHITKSCGCLRRDLSSKRVYKNLSLWITWVALTNYGMKMVFH